MTVRCPRAARSQFGLPRLAFGAAAASTKCRDGPTCADGARLTLDRCEIRLVVLPFGA